ncbi:hypothetical protein DFP72DRAFT_835414 [Ephemerocybe angulata]|uniref:Uncharacterized protein n=1 Tax=Ephemerocybe angulata TaxID=980116 RepID=A0A8H6LSW2_9AGAR|nr:hypothetical protein DFP72DRAFT_835414 [Tulosesus angulatus]
MSTKILEAGKRAQFTDAERDHKRGLDFGALNCGVFFGHGPTEPYNLLNGAREPLLNELLADEDVIRVAAFQSAAFRIFVPKLYKRYHSLRQDVESHLRHRDLKWNFRKSVFSAAAFNFGPQTVTARHRDCMNLPGGFCAITALGEFNSKTGGHLVIEELGIVIEFPAGSTILLPSAVFTHSNTAIQPGETRVSFTQYTSGALFRYADNGYRTEAGLKAYNEDQYDDMLKRKSTRWNDTLKLWSTLEEVLKCAKLKCTGTGEVESDDFVAPTSSI